MAIFKPFRGNRTALDTHPLHDGYAYFCIDDGTFHIDYVDADGNLQRKQLNAKDAETLTGMSLDELKTQIELYVKDSVATYDFSVTDSYNTRTTAQSRDVMNDSNAALKTVVGNTIVENRKFVSASFQGIESESADSTQSSSLLFSEAIECGLGCTIDFEQQKIIQKQVTEYTFNGTERWNFINLENNGQYYPSVYLNLNNYNTYIVTIDMTILGPSYEKLIEYSYTAETAEQAYALFAQQLAELEGTAPAGKEYYWEGLGDSLPLADSTVVLKLRDLPNAEDTYVATIDMTIRDIDPIEYSYTTETANETYNMFLEQLSTIADEAPEGKEYYWEGLNGYMPLANGTYTLKLKTAGTYVATIDMSIYGEEQLFIMEYGGDAMPAEELYSMFEEQLKELEGEAPEGQEFYWAGLGESMPFADRTYVLKTRSSDPNTEYIVTIDMTIIDIDVIEYPYTVATAAETYEMFAYQLADIADQAPAGKEFYWINLGDTLPFENSKVILALRDATTQTFSMRRSRSFTEYSLDMLTTNGKAVNGTYSYGDWWSDPAQSQITWVGILHQLSLDISWKDAANPTETEIDNAMNMFKQYLASLPVSIYYVSNEIVETDFTEEQKAIGNQYTVWHDGVERVVGLNVDKAQVTLEQKYKTASVLHLIDDLENKISDCENKIDDCATKEELENNTTLLNIKNNEQDDKIAELEGRITFVTFAIEVGNTFIEFKSLPGMTMVDWGDGIVNSEFSHTYATSGEYICKIYDLTEIAFSRMTYGQMQGATWITNVIIGDSVTSIGDNAFVGCIHLQKIVIPDNVMRIGNWAFSNCMGLTDVTISDNVTSIGFNAFEYCYSLTKIRIPNGVTSIQNDVFVSCPNLTEVIIPNSVTEIQHSAFTGCTQLRNIILPDSLIEIGDYVFEGCGSLTSLTIPENVTTLGVNLFYQCLNLTSVIFKNKVPATVPSHVFNGAALQNIFVPYGCSEIYKTKWAENHVEQSMLDIIVESDKEASVSDYNQKDKSKSDYIANRPFYDDREVIGGETYYPEYDTTAPNSYCKLNIINFSEIKTNGIVYYTIGKLNTLTGNYDIEHHQETAAQAIESGILARVPLDYSVNPPYGWCALVNDPTDRIRGLNVISIQMPFSYGDGELKQLEEKFIPETIARVEDIKSTFETTTSFVTENKYAERVTANGQSVANGSAAILKKVVGNTLVGKNKANLAEVFQGGDPDADWYPNVTKQEDGSYHMNQIGIGNVWNDILFLTLNNLKQGVPYTLSVKIKKTTDTDASNAVGFAFVYSDGTRTDKRIPATDYELLTITSDPSKTIVGVGTYYNNYPTQVDFKDFQIEEGATVTEYQPYFVGIKSVEFNGIESKTADGLKSFRLAFPETIKCGLGCTIDFENQKIVDYSAEIGADYPSIVYSSATGIFTFGGIQADASFNTQAMSSYYPYVAYGNSENACFWITSEGDDLRIKDSRFSSAEELITFMQDNDVKFTYVSRIAQETPFTDAQKAVGNSYMVWNQGMEKVIDQNSDYVQATLTQEYTEPSLAASVKTFESNESSYATTLWVQQYIKDNFAAFMAEYEANNKD